MKNTEITPENVYTIASQYVNSVAAFTKQTKPEANDLEIVGSIYTIINIVLDSMKNEQLQNSSTEASEAGTNSEPQQVQTAGKLRGIGESPQGSSEAEQKETNGNSAS